MHDLKHCVHIHSEVRQCQLIMAAINKCTVVEMLLDVTSQLLKFELKAD